MMPLLTWTGSVLAAALFSQRDSAPVSVKPMSRPIQDWCSCLGVGCEISYGAERKISYGALYVPSDAGMEWVFMPDYLHKDMLDDILDEAEPYTEKLFWEPYFDDDGNEPQRLDLIIQAKTWPVYDLWPELRPGQKTESPSGRWAYMKKVLKRGHGLPISGIVDKTTEDLMRGQVVFDGDVNIPILLEGGRVWMSTTPFEVFSQKEAADWASGHVVIAGLGMGWQLVRVALNPKVDRITIVELNRELADWILPRLCKLLPKNKPIDVVIGNAFEVIPTLDADTYLIDIWPEYGSIEEDMDQLMESVPSSSGKRRRWWGWGNDWAYDAFWVTR